MRTELGRQSIQFRGPIKWNSLNKELKKQTNRETFKRHLRSDMKTLNKLSFGKETTFNANRMEIMFTIRNKIRDNFDIRLETILTFTLIFKQTFVIKLVFLSRSTSAFCCQILTWVN